MGYLLTNIVILGAMWAALMAFFWVRKQFGKL